MSKRFLIGFMTLLLVVLCMTATSFAWTRVMYCRATISNADDYDSWSGTVVGPNQVKIECWCEIIDGDSNDGCDSWVSSNVNSSVPYAECYGEEDWDSHSDTATIASGQSKQVSMSCGATINSMHTDDYEARAQGLVQY